MGLPNTTYIASQNGRPISDPWQAVVRVAEVGELEYPEIEKTAQEAFLASRKIPALLADTRSRYPYLPEIRFR